MDTLSTKAGPEKGVVSNTSLPNDQKRRETFTLFYNIHWHKLNKQQRSNITLAPNYIYIETQEGYIYTIHIETQQLSDVLLVLLAVN